MNVDDQFWPKNGVFVRTLDPKIWHLVVVINSINLSSSWFGSRIFSRFECSVMLLFGDFKLTSNGDKLFTCLHPSLTSGLSDVGMLASVESPRLCHLLLMSREMPALSLSFLVLFLPPFLLEDEAEKDDLNPLDFKMAKEGAWALWLPMDYKNNM